jgi:nucleoid-associated protein YgaU
MAQAPTESAPTTLELRFKRWTAVGVVCFLGLLAALPFRANPHVLSPTVAPSHRERSLRFRAESADNSPGEAGRDIGVAPAKRVLPATKRPGIVMENSSLISENASEKLQTASTNPARKVSGIWTAEDGQNLMDIAEDALGDRRRWRELIELNPQIRSPFDPISAGASIVLPKTAE